MSNPLLDNPRGDIWAEEFCRMFSVLPKDRLIASEDADEWAMDLMTGWFSAAIEGGRMHPDDNTMLRLLVGDRLDIYSTDAEFKYGIDWFRQVIPLWVDTLAAACELNAVERAERLRVMEAALPDSEQLIASLRETARGDQRFE